MNSPMKTSPRVESTSVGSQEGDVTRYLCVGAYTDTKFAQQVVEQVIADERGMVAPSPGVDLVPVARHCLAARELAYTRDTNLTLTAAFCFLFAPAWVLLFGWLLRLTTSAAAAEDPKKLSTRGFSTYLGNISFRKIAAVSAALCYAIIF